ncbi:unnamed protein product [Thlaspi arvense]|uniref:Terpene synthase N-terminal domain-containing protein n=1 Tax=Thlaspi arvense TaxID=13288 RepID=A0AAU9SCT4_THLAR|nr:unnamed protein product [Thlaspi arvense]
MASLMQIGSPLIHSSALVKTIPRPKSFTCTTMAKTTPGDESPVVPRLFANYQPSIWDNHHLLPVKNKYVKGKSVRGERDLLKEEVRMMLNDGKTTYLDQLELIDDLQKLGVPYYFEREIKNILTVFCYQEDRRIMRQCDIEKDIHATALDFEFSDNVVLMFQKMYSMFSWKIVRSLRVMVSYLFTRRHIFRKNQILNYENSSDLFNTTTQRLLILIVSGQSIT